MTTPADRGLHRPTARPCRARTHARSAPAPSLSHDAARHDRRQRDALDRSEQHDPLPRQPRAIAGHARIAIVERLAQQHAHRDRPSRAPLLPRRPPASAPAIVDAHAALDSPSVDVDDIDGDAESAADRGLPRAWSRGASSRSTRRRGARGRDARWTRGTSARSEASAAARCARAPSATPAARHPATVAATTTTSRPRQMPELRRPATASARTISPARDPPPDSAPATTPAMQRDRDEKSRRRHAIEVRAFQAGFRARDLRSRHRDRRNRALSARGEVRRHDVRPRLRHEGRNVTRPANGSDSVNRSANWPVGPVVPIAEP